MFSEKNRGRRAAAESKALVRKAQKAGVKLSGRDAGRLTKVNGRIVKFSIDKINEDYSDEDQY